MERVMKEVWDGQCIELLRLLSWSQLRVYMNAGHDPEKTQMITTQCMMLPTIYQSSSFFSSLSILTQLTLNPCVRNQSWSEAGTGSEFRSEQI